MSAEANKNVQIAANHLSLEDLEIAQQRARESQRRHAQQNRPIGGLERPSRADSVQRQDTEPSKPERANVAKQTAASQVQAKAFEDLVVVSIPAIDDRNVLEIIQPNQGLENRLQRIPQQVHSVPMVDERHQVHRQNEERPVPKEVSERPIQTPMVGLKVSEGSAVRSDLSETPDDWIPSRDKGEKRSNKQAKTLEGPQQAFTELTNQVLDDFPLGPSSVLLVADVDGKSSGYAVAYQLAHHLAERKVGKVLIIDSHFEERELTCRLALGSEVGLADMLAIGKTLQETVCETDLANLDVLPVGTERMCMRRAPESTWIADNIRALRDEYQFVIVSVGNVFHRSTAMWAQHCDASYMAIELGASNRTVAKSGVVRLQQFGARLMGCVVTDAAAA